MASKNGSSLTLAKVKFYEPLATPDNDFLQGGSGDNSFIGGEVSFERQPIERLAA